MVLVFLLLAIAIIASAAGRCGGRCEKPSRRMTMEEVEEAITALEKEKPQNVVILVLSTVAMITLCAFVTYSYR